MLKVFQQFRKSSLRTARATTALTTTVRRRKSDFNVPKVDEDEIDEITPKSKSLKAIKIEVLPYTQPYPGSNLYWDGDSQSLYYSDRSKRMVRYEYKTEKLYSCDLTQYCAYPSFLIPLHDDKNKLAVGIGKSVELLNWNGIDGTCSEVITLLEVENDDEQQFEHNRFNVGKCDPYGSLFVGTTRDHDDNMSYRFGSIYKYLSAPDEVKSVFIGVSIPNGFSWTKDASKFYFVDTGILKIIECKYDHETRMPIDPRPVYDLKEQIKKGQKLVFPLDMTIDEEDNIFLTTLNKGTISKINTKTWKVCHEIRLPCEAISSICFGGPDLDILFASVLTKANVKENWCFIKICGLGSKGLPMSKLKYQKM